MNNRLIQKGDLIEDNGQLCNVHDIRLQTDQVVLEGAISFSMASASSTTALHRGLQSQSFQSVRRMKRGQLGGFLRQKKPHLKCACPYLPRCRAFVKKGYLGKT